MAAQILAFFQEAIIFMAKRPNQNDDGEQLNLFSLNQNHYDSNHTDPIRQNGGETLARIPPDHGGGNGSQGRPSGDALGGRGENGERVVRNQNNYRISPADGVGAGSPKEKCRANLAAIKLVRKLQAENRPASQEDKSALVRYVGWGGLPQIFSPATDWQAESRELARLISKEEFRLARASTLNAHYTSGEIIQGMYAALARLGFKEGRILEPACGIGH